MANSSPRPLPFFVDKYECREFIGGNMSEVYLAFDSKGHRQVAIKLMRPEDARDPELRQRFLQEGRLACRCSHPNVITTYETDEFQDEPFIAMEYLQGKSLRDLMDQGELSTQSFAFRIAYQIADALEYLHSVGILHRDIKPTNIHVSRNGTAKIFDFGIARGEGFSLTRVGDVMGTPRYMAPEQILGETVTAETDIYSFGVLLFEILTLNPPYDGSSFRELTAVIVNGQPKYELLQQCQVPDAIVQLIKSCLQKSASQRPSSFEPVMAGLHAYAVEHRAPTVRSSELQSQQSPVPVQSPTPVAKWKIWAPVAAVLALGVVAVSLWMNGSTGKRGANGQAQTALQSSRPSETPPRVLQAQSGEMVLVPAGKALLGKGREQKNVAAFYIDRTEVPVHTYLEFCSQRGLPPPSGATALHPNLPIVNVSFADAEQFAKWAHERLPTAEEWEKAARGPDGKAFPWGDHFERSRANLSGANADPVDSFPNGASPYGVLNMLGNVWEWVDTSAEAPPDAEFRRYRDLEFPHLNPPLSPHEPFYQIRGGSYTFNLPKDSSPADLIWDSGTFPARARKPDVGFRCARDVTP